MLTVFNAHQTINVHFALLVGQEILAHLAQLDIQELIVILALQDIIHLLQDYLSALFVHQLTLIAFNVLLIVYAHSAPLVGQETPVQHARLDT